MKPKNHPDITAERLRSILSYDPATGTFYTLVQRQRLPPGSVVGTLVRYGYVRIRIEERLYYAHRLAWLYMHGHWPADQLDHINGIRDDNRLANLREATASENQQNRAVSKKNKSKILGVSWDRRKSQWRAGICVNKKRQHLGTFPLMQDAEAAYAKAKSELHQFQPRARKT